MQPQIAAAAPPASKVPRNCTWSETTAGSPAMATSLRRKLSFPAVYAPTAMNPAWPMENCPVILFTMFRDTARMTFTPTMDAR